jgi:uncharacterized protein (UPF0332 family)
METMFEMCTTKKHRSVVQFLWTKGLNTMDIHKEMFSIYKMNQQHKNHEQLVLQETGPS